MLCLIFPIICDYFCLIVESYQTFTLFWLFRVGYFSYLHWQSLELHWVSHSQQANVVQQLHLHLHQVSDRIWEYILFRNVEHCGTGSAPGISSHQFRNYRNWFDSESVEVAAIEPNSGIERNSWESVRFHRDGIGWNWFRWRNWFRNVQHRGIGWLLCY